jgi:hypothetical protein
MAEVALLEDGYSIETTIPRLPGLHPAVKVRFRPALSEERFQWLMDSERDLNGKSRSDRLAKLLARYIEAWDVKRATGQEVSCRDEAVIKRVQPTLQAKLLDLVLGYTPAQEEDDAKNSSPASSS